MNELQEWREERYESILSSPRKSKCLAEIWRRVYGDDYPDSADPFGFVTVPELKILQSELAIGVDQTLIDIGCGRGGPGLWIAERLACTLTGIDILPIALERAAGTAAGFNLRHPPRFQLGGFESTGLPDACADAVLSVDAFWMVLDKFSAADELFRIMKAGARAAMTTWVNDSANLEDLFAGAGLEMRKLIEIDDGIPRQLAVYEDILRHRAQIENEIGAEAAVVLFSEAIEAPGLLAHSTRAIVVVSRPAT